MMKQEEKRTFVEKTINARYNKKEGYFGERLKHKGVIMQYTCAQAAKLLRSLNEELNVLRTKEDKSIRFTAAVDEDLESARPVYDYEEAQDDQKILQAKIRKVKHAINQFNTQTVIPEFDMTIDEMLVYIPQLSERKRKLTEMSSYLPKERVSNSYQATKIVEYTYTNYDIEKVTEDLANITELLGKAQLALDTVNNQETIDIEI